MPRDFPTLKDGERLEPFHLNIIYRELRRWRRAYAVPPLVIDGLMSSDSPPVFRNGGNGLGGFPAVANGNIPARSGSSDGVGSVYSVTVKPTYTAGVLTAAVESTDSTTYDVVYTSSNTMTSGHGIDSGMRCWVQQGNDGLLYVAPMECS